MSNEDSVPRSVETTSSGRSPKRLLVRAVVLLAVLVAIFVWRPLFHPMLYNIFYSPGSLIFFSITGFAALALWFMRPMPSEEQASISRKASLLGSIVVVALVLSALYSLPANMFEERTLAQQTMAEAEEIEEFPEVNEDNARITPRAVADIQTRGSVSYRQHRLGTSDIARMDDGRLAWSYAIQPDGFRNKLYENQRGVALFDMTRMEDQELRLDDETEFAVGEGMLLHRGSRWNLVKTDFFAQYNDDPIEFVHDGEPYLAYPKTGHEWHMTPIPHTTPTWDGVALIHPDGTIDHLSPEEAQESEILDGQRLYPMYNTEREMESLRYRNGIVNQFPTVGAHKNEVHVAELPSSAGNSQPFVIDLEGEQMSYVVAMEPYGADTRGLDEVWFTDADTGQLRYFGTEEETFTGPERAMGIVRSQDPRTGWGDDFVVVEPVPVTIDNELWWHTKVVPVDNTAIARNVFVSAETDEAVALRSTEAVKTFMAGEDPENIEDATEEPVDTEPAPDNQNVAYYIVITDENGEVIERIPVREGEQPNVTIVQPEDVDKEDNETNTTSE